MKKLTLLFTTLAFSTAIQASELWYTVMGVVLFHTMTMRKVRPMNLGCVIDLMVFFQNSASIITAKAA